MAYWTYGGFSYGGELAVPAGPAQTVTVTGIPSAEAFGASRIAHARTLAPAGIASSEAFGAARVAHVLSIYPAGIASAQALGTPTIPGGLVTLRPGGIASAQALGAARIAATIRLAPAGIPSAAALGAATVAFGAILPTRQTIAPAGIPSGESLGAALVLIVTPNAVYPVGWAELEPFGVPAISLHPTVILAAGIASAETVGVPLLLTTAAPSPPAPGAPPRAPAPRNYLIDRITREVYPWPVNHATEDAIKTLGRQLQRSGINPGGFMIRQRTHPGAAHLALHGNMIDRTQAQYRTFVRFFRECDSRTFDYIDASGDSYHVAITSFDARRKISPTRADGSYFEYSLEAEVIAVNQGALAGHVS
jgi:hypothetical protein